MGKPLVIAQQTITYQNGETNSTGIVITPVTNPTDLTIASGSAIQSGTISESGISFSGEVEKDGSGTLTLTGDNTYTGSTTINAGTLAIGTGGSLDDSSGVDLASSGTTFDISGGGNQTIMGLSGVSGSTVNLGFNTLSVSQFGGQPGGITTFAGTIQGSGGLTLTETGKLILTGPNTFTGVTTVSGGTLQFEQESSLYDGQTARWTSANIDISSGATLALNVGGSGEFTSSDVTTLLQNVGNGTGGFAGGSAIGFDTTNASEGIFTYSGNIANANSGNNALGLVKLGSGTLSLSGINTYSGPTTITAGALQLNGSLAASSTISVVSAGTLSGSGTVNGNATLTGNGTINFASSANIVGSLSVTGGNWNGAGTVEGAVTVSSSTLKFGPGASLTANGGLNVTGSGALSGSGAITGSLDYSSSSYSFAGPIAGASNTVTMNNPQGTLTLLGASTYTGATTVTAGLLIVEGSTSPASTVTVGAEGIFYPGGGGVAGGNVILNGGQLTMDSATIDGTLNINGGTWVGGNGTVDGQITVSSGQFTLKGASVIAPAGLFVTGGSITDGTTSDLNIGSILEGSLTYTSPAAGTIGEIIDSNSAPSSVTVNNPSANLTLYFGNYSGPTTIKAGTLTVNGPIGSVEVDSGATLAGNASGAVEGNVNLLGGTVNMTGLIGGTVTATGNNLFEGALSVFSPITSVSGIFTLGSGADLWAYEGLNITGGTLVAGNTSSTIIGNVNYTSSSNSTFSGIITGSGSTLTLNSSGTTLSLTGANTYAGGTIITGGILQVASIDTNLGSGNITLGGGELQTTATTTTSKGITLNEGMNVLAAAATTTATYNGIISGSGTLDVGDATDNGDVVLGTANTYTGNTTVHFGTLTVQGAGNISSANSTLNVGYKSGDSGNLLISNGGQVSDDEGDIGALPGASGSATVSGVGASGLAATWNNSVVYVGGQGTGSLTIANGGLVTDVSGWVGPNAGSVGTATVTGINANGTRSTWNNSYYLEVGNSGLGALNIQDGGLVSDEYGYLGNGSANGTATVTGINANGTPSTWNNYDLYVGALNTGTLTIEDGGLVTDTSGYVGSSQGSGNGHAGSATVAGVNADGVASTWTNLALYVGGGNPGTLTIQNGGLVIGEFVYVGQGEFSGTVNLNSNGILEADTVRSNPGNNCTINFNGGILLCIGEVGASSLLEDCTVTLATGGGTINNNRNAVTDIGTTFSGPGALTSTGAGTFTLTGANTYTGGTIIQSGVLAINTVASAGSAQPLGEGNSVNFTGFSAASPGVLQYTGGTGTLSQNLAVSAGDHGLVVNTGGGVLTLSGTISNNGSALTLAGGAFVINGSVIGSVANSDLEVGTSLYPRSTSVGLTTANSYNGMTTVSNGSTLLTGVAGALPMSALSAVTLGASSDSSMETNTIDLLGTSQTIASLTARGPGINQVISSNGSASGIPAVGTGASAIAGTLTIDNSLNDTFSGSLGGSGGENNFGLIKEGTGTLTLTGASTYVGGTTIRGGIVQVASIDTSLGSGNLIISGGALVTSATGATSKAITLRSGSNILASTAGTTETYKGVISGFGSLIIDGAANTSAVTLAGTDSYTGTTTVEHGTLDLTGSLLGSTVVDSGGILAGAGSMDGTLTIAGGGVVELAAANSNRSLVVGGLTLGSSGAYDSAHYGVLYFTGGPHGVEQLDDANHRLTANNVYVDLASGVSDGIYTLATFDTTTIRNFSLSSTKANVASVTIEGKSYTINDGSTADTLVLTVTSTQAPQTIRFPSISTQTFGSAPFSLNATASSGLDISYRVVSGPATISGDTVTLTGAGTVALAAIQAGDADYLAASEVMTTFSVTDLLGGNEVTPNFESSPWFGNYSYISYPRVYQYNLGDENVSEAGDGGVYLYDFGSGHLWYTSSSIFPEIYDYSLGTYLYYDTNSPSSTARSFYNYATGKVITE